MTYSKDDISAIILAGGQGRRLGGKNKGLLDIEGETFVTRLLSNLSTQTKTQIISANNDISQYQQLNRTVIQDKNKNYQGPLSGIISCQAEIHTDLILTVPCDSPLIPTNLTEKLLLVYNQNPKTRLCVVHDGERRQNLLMLFHRDLLENMQQYFQAGNRKVQTWIKQQNYSDVDFSKQAINFTNINNESDMNRLLTLLKQENSRPQQ